MGMKQGVNALTKTVRIASTVIFIVIGVIAVSGDRYGAEFIVTVAALLAVSSWVVAWVLDKFVE